MQVDALRAELQALQAENRKLREQQWDGVEHARELELTEELVTGRQENLELTQQLSVVNTQLASVEHHTETPTRGTEEQVLELQQQVEEQSTIVANQQQELSNAQEQMERLRRQLECERDDAELARFRAVAQETSKWEARERRLLQQLDNLQQSQLGTRLSLGRTSATRRDWASPSNLQVSGLMTFSACTTTLTTHTSPSLVRTMPFSMCTSNITSFVELSMPHSSNLTTLYTTPVNTQFDTQLNVPHTLSSTTLYTTPPVSSQPSGPSTEGTRLSALASTFKPSNVVSQGNVSAWPSTSGSGGSAIDNVTAALLAQQIPPLSKFSGEVSDGEGECFSDWKEQFELVAGACYWTDQSKLVNLVTPLRGQAYSYYRSCTSEQRSCYPLLVKALEDRFTPVRIQAVQSSRFHERKQSPTESVDSYAQDLRKLYQKAYPSTRQGSREVEAKGRSVLAYQFIAELLPHLKAKIAGQEGTFEELLTKTRFEEARHRDIVEAAGVGNRHPTTNLTMGTGRNSLVYRKSNPLQSTPRSVVGRQPEPLRCYHCGGTNHLRRDYPLRGRSAPLEAVANKTVNNGVQNRSGSTGVNSNRSGSTVMIPNPGKKVAMLTADKE